MTTPGKKAVETRQAILNIAIDEVHCNGFRATGLNDVLCKAGVTKGAFYHHFKSKSDFGLAVVREIFERTIKQLWIKPLEQEDAGVNTLQNTIEYAMAATNERFATLGCPLGNIVTEMANQDEKIRQALIQMMDQWRFNIRKVLKSDQEKGLIRGDVDCESSSYFILSALEGAMTLTKPYHSPGPYRTALRGLLGYLQSLKTQ